MAERLHDRIIAQVKRQLGNVRRQKKDGTWTTALQAGDIRTDAMFNLDDFPLATPGHPVAAIYQDGHREIVDTPLIRQTINLDDGRILRITSKKSLTVAYIVEVRVDLEDLFYGAYDIEILNAFADTRAFVWEAFDILDDEQQVIEGYNVRVEQVIERLERTILEVERDAGKDEDGNQLQVKVPVACAWELALTFKTKVYRQEYAATVGRLHLQYPTIV